jgi:hypothetical protein
MALEILLLLLLTRMMCLVLFGVFILSTLCLLSLNTFVFLIGHQTVDLGSKKINNNNYNFVNIKDKSFIIIFTIFPKIILLKYGLFVRLMWHFKFSLFNIIVREVTLSNFRRTLLPPFIGFFFTLHFISLNEGSVVPFPTHKFTTAVVFVHRISLRSNLSG